ncbi:LCP family protein [Streptomyces cavernae]|uniref:LCP family protein n=1 Tax=Streptomyces cavernae TaxID=2259034 RepID=UPI001EE3D340|nr:LCP family protein [Streptomyces cavernae]
MPTPTRSPRRARLVPPRGAPPAPARRLRARRWAARLATTLSVVVLASSGIGHVVVSSLDGDIARIDPFKDMKNRPRAGHGMNVLLVGTDGRDGVTSEARHKYRLGGAPCNCTDTIIIVHVSEGRDRASVVSLPRDSYAEIPPHTNRTTGRDHGRHRTKLNAAYAEGGPQLTVRTIEHMTGVKIDHYLEVDFTSFMKTVDVLGGVQICTAQPLKDSHTGLNLAAGTHDLDGGQALQYVRSRHVDAAGDLSRMQRQQRFLAALVERATSSGVLLNPVTFREVGRAVLGSVRADEGFGMDEMLELGRALRDFSPSSSEFTTVPLASDGRTVKGIGWTVKWDREKSRELFRALRDDRPLTPPQQRARVVRVDVAPERIRVRVENGTTTEGLGRRVDSGLRGVGFRTTGRPRNAVDREVKRTVVAYDPRWDRSARSLAAALPGAELREAPGQGPVLRVIAGADFKGVTRVRARTPEQEQEENRFEPVTGDQVTC